MRIRHVRLQRTTCNSHVRLGGTTCICHVRLERTTCMGEECGEGSREHVSRGQVGDGGGEGSMFVLERLM